MWIKTAWHTTMHRSQNINGITDMKSLRHLHSPEWRMTMWIKGDQWVARGRPLRRCRNHSSKSSIGFSSILKPRDLRKKATVKFWIGLPHPESVDRVIQIIFPNEVTHTRRHWHSLNCQTDGENPKSKILHKQSQIPMSFRYWMFS